MIWECVQSCSNLKKKKKELESNFSVEWISDSSQDPAGRQWTLPMMAQSMSKIPSVGPLNQLPRMDTYQSTPECSLSQTVSQCHPCHLHQNRLLSLLKCRISDPNPNLLSQNLEAETETLQAKVLPGKTHWPKLGHPCSRAVGRTRSELHAMMELGIANDK